MAVRLLQQQCGERVAKAAKADRTSYSAMLGYCLGGKVTGW